MKNVASKLAVVALSASLVVGCSTNTQSQNTGIGAVTGAAAGGVVAGVLGASPLGIAASAVAGGLLGGWIGHSMDHTDQVKVGEGLSGPTNKPVKWTNPNTGKTYTVIPTSDFMTINGHSNCRTFKIIKTKHGKQKVKNGTACRQSNGTWTDLK